MRVSFHRTVQMSAAVALAIGVWAAWAHTAKSWPNVAVYVDRDVITYDEIERRARLLALNANITEQAKANFQRLLKSPDLEAKLKALQREVLTSNPGKTREELIAIFKERQKEIANSLQKEAVEAARAELLPKLRKDAREQLIAERQVQSIAKAAGVEVTDDEVRGLVADLAGRNNMTYDQFAEHLKGMGVDIATLLEKFRAQKLRRKMRAPDSPTP